MDTKTLAILAMIVFVGVFLAIEASKRMDKQREAEELKLLNAALSQQTAA